MQESRKAPMQNRRWPSKRIALVFQQLKILLLVTIEEHAHLPWSREHLRILDQRFVSQVVRSSWRVAFNHVQGVTVEISGPVEPGPVVEIGHIDHQRISFPTAARVPQPPIEAGARMRSVHEDIANRMRMLVENRDLLGSLRDLKRKRQIRDARHTGQI